MGILFKRTVVEGFGSFQYPTEFPLNHVGVNMVKGINGAGKTTAFSAFCWGLYKLNLKGVKNEQVVTWERLRDAEFRGTRVIVDFDTDGNSYRIARHINFKGTTLGIKGNSALMIFKAELGETFKEEDLVGEAQHKGDQQAYIDKLLGMDSNTFLNSILFGQRMKRLVDASGDEKRKLFENLFELDFIVGAKQKAKDKFDDYVIQLSKLDKLLSTYETTISNTNDRIDDANKVLKEFKTKKAERLTMAEEKVTMLNNDLKTANAALKVAQAAIPKDDSATVKVKEDRVEEIKKLLKPLTEAVDDLNSTIKKTEKSIKDSKARKEQLEQDLEEIAMKCPTCLQNLPKESVKLAKDNLSKQIAAEAQVDVTLTKELESRKKELGVNEKKITPLETERDGLKPSIDAYYETRKKLTELNQNVTKYSERVKSLDKQLVDAKKAVDTVKAETPPKIDLSGLQKIVKENEDKKKLLEKDKVTLQNKKEKTNWWLQKGFGSGGLKAFVFNAMLNSVNAYTEKYAARLGFRVKFSVDLTMASKPFTTMCYKGNVEIDYKELSGGQKQRIDICLAFAMHDLVSKTSDFNLLIMDEIFEGLDEEGIEAVFDLIRVKAGDGKAVYVITHNQGIDSLNVKTINIGIDEYENSLVL